LALGLTEESHIGASNFRWFPVAMLYFASILSGAIQCASPQFNAFWAIDFFMALSGIYWIKLDARHRNKPIPDIALFLLSWLWGLFAPIYLISTRGFRGFGWTLLHVVGLYAATIAAFFAVLTVLQR